MRRTQKKKQTKISSKTIIMSVIITTIIVTTFTLSKYETTTAGSDNTRTAIPIITMSSDTLDLKLDPENNEQDYIFKVSNYNEQNQTEVSMEYNLQIKSLSNLPLDFELYEYDASNNTAIGENLLTNNVTENVTTKVGEKTQNTYLLKIKWREAETNYLFSQEIDYVQIILNSRQVN